jgi:hypothetical protein
MPTLPFHNARQQLNHPLAEVKQLDFFLYLMVAKRAQRAAVLFT